MINTIYIEEEVADHFRTLSILDRFKNVNKIYCKHYGEIFNLQAQNFRLQKKQPALILAKKHKNYMLPAPKQYNIGAKYNFYFSHMLNCLYDCRYCFLQGMFQSAHYVLFVNYDDFIKEINSLLSKHKDKHVHFFSGYDCDSLAMDPITEFTNNFLPFFAKKTHTLLELRTKSTQIRSLLKRNPIENCVIAFSFSPEKISKALEHKTPTIDKRLKAMLNIQQAGWKLGIRFDPMIYSKTYKYDYQSLFEKIFTKIETKSLHSVSTGGLRLPKTYFKKLEKLFPDETLFHSLSKEVKNKHISYSSSLNKEMLSYCNDIISQYIPSNKLFVCQEID